MLGRWVRYGFEKISAAKTLTRHWGWKLPENILCLPHLFQAFPKARLIHLTRHPVTTCLRRSHMTSRTDNNLGRAVLKASYRSVGRDVALIKSDEQFIRNAYSWRYQLNLAHDFIRGLEPHQYLEVKLELLIEDVVSVTRDIDAFVDLPRVKPVDLGIDSSRLSAIDLTDERGAMIWDICGKVASRFGYKNPY